MNSRWFRIVALCAMLAAGVWGWRVLFPSPEHVIRQQLAELARAASIAPNEGELARVVNSQKLAGFFTPEVQVTVDIPGHSLQTISGRDEIMKLAMTARGAANNVKVEFLDVTVSVDPGKRSATAHLTAKANVPGDSIPQVQELKAAFQKDGRDWLINHIETVKTLR
jgi:hypothetical protein